MRNRLTKAPRLRPPHRMRSGEAMGPWRVRILCATRQGATHHASCGHLGHLIRCLRPALSFRPRGCSLSASVPRSLVAAGRAAIGGRSLSAASPIPAGPRKTVRAARHPHAGEPRHDPWHTTAQQRPLQRSPGWPGRRSSFCANGTTGPARSEGALSSQRQSTPL